MNQKSANPFAFHFKDDSLKPEKSVNYIPPVKRKQMKDYLSNSSINLANGSEVNFDKEDHFRSSNKMMASDLDKAIPYGLMTKERKETIEKNRQRHIWMGRDNEFKRLAGKAHDRTANESAPVANSNNDLAKKLRAHNFNFGYENKADQERARI